MSHFWRKTSRKDADDKYYWKVINHFHFTDKSRGAPHRVYNLKISTPEEVPVVVYNGPNYDYHFIITELEK